MELNAINFTEQTTKNQLFTERIKKNLFTVNYLVKCHKFYRTND